MNVRSWIPAAALLLLAAAAGAGWVATRERPAPAAQEESAPKSQEAKSPEAKPQGAPRDAKRGPRRERLVDQSPLLTARSLVPLAQTSEEQQFARQAERVANHEVDLAFADAIWRAVSDQAPATPEVKGLADLKAKAQATVDADQQLIAGLEKRLAAVPGSQKDVIEDQLDVARAQLELDKDELEAAAEDLARAGGDPQARIRRLKEAHEAADRESSQAMGAALPASAFQAGSLVARFGEWRIQKEKVTRLERARQECLVKAQALEKRRQIIEARSKQEKDDREAAKYWASNLVKESAAAEGGPGRDQAQSAVSYLRQYGDAQRRLSDMGRRIQDQQELAEIYGNWLGVVDGLRKAALHGLLAKLLGILGLALIAYLGGLFVDHAFHRAAAGDRKGAGTLRIVVKLALQAVCLLAAVFLLLGVPAQTSTVLGLAGAGLTVALKDFIVAFFGWFVLMGRNGIRVGDWVEIRGVGGEVVEIGLLRTVVLETGSWSDAGHPTGRRVAFVNSFAIEGHFFNFTTSGQWMWDELRVLIPAGQDPYPVIDGLRKLVENETEANVRQAEQEWRRATARYRVQAFSAAPGLDVVPTAGGVEVRMRYVTRAFERHETRLRLNEAVVALLHGRGEADISAPKAEDR
ncbi:mechanosensitive ion channel family protein [Geothrix sp. 21YS21S-4]|uniref:mechanosensitive ion channel family protein n=1 Tax=Geothrix sp. 21YS21S-4 TaxID=3068889 RepID=UPI0027B8A6FB|nr:mechanosensitive ion channel domain-containing protein [Geothrix sp. 21YS21S-4]